MAHVQMLCIVLTLTFGRIERLRLFDGSVVSEPGLKAMSTFTAGFSHAVLQIFGQAI